MGALLVIIFINMERSVSESRQAQFYQVEEDNGINEDGFEKHFRRRTCNMLVKGFGI